MDIEKYISYSTDGTGISVAIFSIEVIDEESETCSRYGWYYGHEKVGSGFTESCFKRVEDLGEEEISYKIGMGPHAWGYDVLNDEVLEEEVSGEDQTIFGFLFEETNNWLEFNVEEGRYHVLEERLEEMEKDGEYVLDRMDDNFLHTISKSWDLAYKFV